VREPFAGWTDSTAAAGGISLMICLGVITQIDETGESRADVIPVDIVSNGIIITTAHCAQISNPDGKGNLFIYNCGTSDKNPITWKRYGQGLVEANKYLEFNRKIRPVDFKFIGTDPKY
jgi:hypothetical protein